MGGRNRRGWTAGTEREGRNEGGGTKKEEEEAAPLGRDIRHLRTAADNTEDTQLGGKLGPARISCPRVGRGCMIN